jgi:hypothetical protein
MRWEQTELSERAHADQPHSTSSVHPPTANKILDIQSKYEYSRREERTETSFFNLPIERVHRIMASKQRGGMSATPRLGMKRGSPTNGDLSQALQLLDEETMSQACSLLLSQRDYGIGDDAVKVDETPGKDTITTNGETDYDKLLAIYAKCRDIALKVEQQIPAMSLPNLSTSAPPPTLATTPSARAAAKKAHLLNAMSPPRRMSMKQKMGRAASIKLGAGGLEMTSKAGVISRTGKAVVGGPNMVIRPISLKREASDSSIASSSSASSRVSGNKKARLSSGTSNNSSAATSSEGKKAAAPPPAALNFLQALNNQQKEKEEEVAPTPEVDDDEEVTTPSGGRASRSRAAKKSAPVIDKSENKGKRSSPRTRL